jgi:hypothetical protein
MRGLTIDEIKNKQLSIIKRSSNEISKCGFDPDNVDLIAHYSSKGESPLHSLGLSLATMDKADLVLVSHDYSIARGCLIEYIAAEKYGKPTVMAPPLGL